MILTAGRTGTASRRRKGSQRTGGQDGNRGRGRPINGLDGTGAAQLADCAATSRRGGAQDGRGGLAADDRREDRRRAILTAGRRGAASRGRKGRQDSGGRIGRSAAELADFAATSRPARRAQDGRRGKIGERMNLAGVPQPSIAGPADRTRNRRQAAGVAACTAGLRLDRPQDRAPIPSTAPGWAGRNQHGAALRDRRASSAAPAPADGPANGMAEGSRPRQPHAGRHRSADRTAAAPFPRRRTTFRIEPRRKDRGAALSSLPTAPQAGAAAHADRPALFPIRRKVIALPCAGRSRRRWRSLANPPRPAGWRGAASAER